MKLLLFISFLSIFAGCSTSKVSPEVRERCSKVCQEQNLRFFESDDDANCVCSEKPEKLLLERHHNSKY